LPLLSHRLARRGGNLEGRDMEYHLSVRTHYTSIWAINSEQNLNFAKQNQFVHRSMAMPK